MAYKFLEHEADMGILGIGNSWEESFQESAKAMFEVMFNLKQIKKEKKIKFEINAENEENLFIKFLNELLAQADINSLAFCDFDVTFKKNKNNISLNCTAYGSDFDLKKLEIKTEVKAATYSGLKVYQKDKKYYSQCVLDV